MTEAVIAPPEKRAELTKALVKAQAVMQAAAKDGLNPAFKSKFSTLASVWEAIRKPLTDNGLAVAQQVTVEEGKVLVTTRLMHVSGEELIDHLPMPIVQNTPQGIGSAITYARRYGLCGLVGVVSDDDDDGNAASSSPTPPAPKGAAQVKAAASNNLNAAAVKKLCADAGLAQEEASAFVNGVLQGKKQSEVSAADVEAVKVALAERKK